MKTLGLVVFAFALLGAASPLDPADGSTALSTERRVQGVITSVDPQDFRITDTQKAVTGRIDAQRTKVTVNGVPAKLTDVKLAAHAKGELCLDDVWVAIDVH
jgi:hypothetical protein